MLYKIAKRRTYKAQRIALGYAVLLAGAAALNYIPGLTDHHGRSFGVFALDLQDDLLHVGSATWALSAGLLSRRSALAFLRIFGALYFADGLLGLITGSGYLDLGIILYGRQDLGLIFKLLANAPHLALGGFALFASVKWRA